MHDYTTDTPYDAARQIVEQMSDDDRRTYTRTGWSEGIGMMLSEDWSHLEVSDVLDAIAEAVNR